MKLSTLLLSSAALVVAGSAFAADLPAKKGAPAKAAATGCPAFGAGYFQIPGGDNCIKFSGYAAYDGSLSGNQWTQSGDARLIVDTAANTDLGALKTRLRVNGSTSTGNSGIANSSSVAVSRAWGQIGGFKFGKDDSHADISGVGAGGTYAWNGGTGLGGGTGTGLWYSTSVGSATIEIGEESAIEDSQASTQSVRPDVMLKGSFSAGAASFTVMGISHSPNDYTTDANGNGYAFLGQAQVKQDAFGVAVFGGVSNGATKYTSSVPSTAVDMYGGQLSTGSNIGAEVTYSIAGGTLAAFAGQAISTAATTASSTQVQTTTNYVDVSFDYPIAKGLYVEPEVLNKSGTSTSTTYYLTIHRDF